MERQILSLFLVYLCTHTLVAQYDLNGGSSCENEWKFVTETSKTGTIVQGGKTQLIEAVRHGARVRVFVGEWGGNGYSAEADNIHVMSNNADVCIQLLQAVSKAGFDSFQDNAYWWWTFICSSGHVHMTRYNVGSSTFRGDTRTTIAAKWFVKFPGPKRVAFYHNNAAGGRTDGALFSVADALVDNGADIRGLSDNAYSFAMQNIMYSMADGYLAGQSLNHVSTTTSGNVASFQSNAYWWFTTLSTDGTRDMSRWTVGDHIDRTHNSDTTDIKWFADRCWKLVYTSGNNGENLFGTRDELVNAIKSGARVRFMTQSEATGDPYITEADFIWVRNGHVTVQALGHVSKNGTKKFQDNAYWFWIMASTTGNVKYIRYNVGANVHRGTTATKKPVHWFIETRPWKLALAHESDGSVTSGSRADLVSAVQGGASVQIVSTSSQDELASFPAHNLALKSLPSGIHVAAQNVRTVSVQKTSASCFEYEIQPNPYWWFSIVTTQGKRDMIRYTVGTHDTRGHNQDTVALNWFTNL